MDSNQTRNTTTTGIFRPHCVTRAFWRDHKDVYVGAWLDQVEMNIQTMRKCNRSTRTDIFSNFVSIDIGLQFIRGQHHDDIAPL